MVRMKESEGRAIRGFMSTATNGSTGDDKEVLCLTNIELKY